jgi:hypothetical protein
MSLISAALLLTLAAGPRNKAADTTLDYSTTWVGNTFGGGPKWVQNVVRAVALDEDGAIYANNYWDEGGRQAGVYRDGDVVGMMKDTHGWGHTGGVAIAIDDRYVYMAFEQSSENGHLKGPGYPPNDEVWYCVSRRHKDGSHAPFPGGTGDKGDLLVIAVGHRSDKVPNHSRAIHGLAVDRGEMFISDPKTNRVRVIQTSTMRQVRQWAVNDPRDIAATERSLWMIQGDPDKSKARIIEYDRDGRRTGKVITGVPKPLGLCIDPKGRVLIADSGPRQQILFYDVSGAAAKLVDTLGEEHGVFAEPVPGKVGPNRLCGPSDVAVNAKGEIAVSCLMPAGGTILRLFSPKHEMLWELLGLEFVDAADADPMSDGTEIYSARSHYHLDRNGWSWKGFTLDPFSSPDDPRLTVRVSQCSASIQYIEGRRFLACRGMRQNLLAFYRFDGEIARPCSIIAAGSIPEEHWPDNGRPKQGRWLWRDLNGDAKMQRREYQDADGKDDSKQLWASYVDERGDVWQGTIQGLIRHFHCGGLDGKGNPIYARTAKLYDERQAPPPISVLLRAIYAPATDSMYLSGYVPERSNTDKRNFGMVGSDLIRYDRWSTRHPRIRWRVLLPQWEGFLSGAASLCVEADRIFVVMGRSAEVRVYDTETGTYIGSMYPGPEVHGESGFIDIRDAIHARKLSNGDYLVIVEEDNKAKNIVYRLRGQK